MGTIVSSFKQLTLSLGLAVAAVVVLTAALGDTSAQTEAPLSTASLIKHAAPYRTVAIDEWFTLTPDVSVTRLPCSFWLTDFMHADNEAQADTCQWDVALTFDRSGSMGEETRCYGCWEPDLSDDYPTGFTYPLPYNIVPGDGVAIHCQPSEPLNSPLGSSDWYVSIEAEHYSRYLIEADYHYDQTEYPKTWWAMQRQPNKNTSGPDSRGAFMKVGPHSEGAIHYDNVGDIEPPASLATTPRLDYDFTVPVDDTYYVWIRAQGGASFWPNAVTRRRVHVGLDAMPMATGETPFHGPYGDGADANNWRWTRVLTLTGLIATGPDNPYTLNFWAAGPGFSLDKIVITSSPRTDLDSGGRPLDWDYPGVEDAGPVETHGRTAWACLGELDPRFAPLNPATGELDDLYDDVQPLRAAKEATKGSVRRLNPVLDQVAFVEYSAVSTITEELYCKEQTGGCDDLGKVAASIESASASQAITNDANIAAALWDGIWALMPGQEPEPDPGGQGLPPKTPGRQHFGRTSVTRILILMTDSQANTYPILPSGYGDCYSDDLWPDQPGETVDQRRARECVVWFGLHARDHGVVIYTIGLGLRADNELLAYLADLTGGWYYSAPSAGELDAVLRSIETGLTADCPFSIQVAKRVKPEVSVTLGAPLTYTIQTTVSGRVRPSLRLTDYVPTQTVFITATSGFTPAAPIAGGPLVWLVSSGAFTQPLTLTHTVVLSASGPAGVLTNTVIAADDAGLATATASVATTIVGPEKLYLPLIQRRLQ